jgi:hypothetical protein
MRLAGIAALTLALVAPPLVCHAGFRTVGHALPGMERHRVEVIYDYNSGDPAYLGYFWAHHPCAHHHHIYDRQGGPWPGDPAKGDKPPPDTQAAIARCPGPAGR